MKIEVRRAISSDLAGAAAVWLEANIARGLPPSAARIARVGVKLAADDAVVLVAVDQQVVVGMLQAEAGRSERDEQVVGLGHVSMVFVAPDRQGEGIGAALLAGLSQTAAVLGWSRLSLWTRRSNQPARRCYEKAGFHQTPETKSLPDGSAIDRWET